MPDIDEDILDGTDSWTRLVPALSGMVGRIRSNSATLESVLSNGWVATARLADKSVTSSKVADKAIGAGQLADKGVTGDKLSAELYNATCRKSARLKIISSGNAWYRRIGNMVEVSVSITNTDAITATAQGVQIGTLPTGYRPPVQIDVGATVKGNGSGQLSVLSNGIIRIYSFASNTQYYGSHMMYFTDEAWPS